MVTLISLLMVSLMTHLSHQTSSCGQNSPTLSPNDPKFPTPPDQYQSVVEVTLSERNRTLSVRQYVDTLGKQVTLQIMESGHTHIILVNFITNQLFNVRDGVCDVHNISATNYTMLLPDYAMEGLVFDPLNAGDALTKVYMNQTNIRGITVDHWKSCPYMDKRGNNYTLDIYFSTDNWDDTEAVTQVPVRLVAVGDRLLSTGALVHFRHSFDVIDFRPNIADQTVFMTPTDVVCLGRASTKVAPTISRHFYAAREEYDSKKQTILYSSFWYDYESKLARYDYQTTTDTPLISAYTAVVMVRDFTYGISYTKIPITGNCVATPITASLDVHFNTASTNGTSTPEMDLPETVMLMSDGLVYTGQRMVRGLLCDEYESLQTINGTQFITKHYFLVPGEQLLPDDSGSISQVVPVRITISNSSLGFNKQIDFLKFSEDRPDVSVFDVTACYSKAAQLQLSVTFQGQHKFGLLEQLRTLGRKQLCLAMGVALMRLPEVEVDYDNAFVYLKVTLLDKYFDIGSIKGPPEINVTQAYNNLVASINNGSIQLQTYLPYLSDPVIFTAVDVKVVFGILEKASFPIVQSQFSYHMEKTVPKLKTTVNSHVWYDYQYQVERFDNVRKDGTPRSTIHDYNTGLAYEINRATGECLVGPIGAKSHDVIPSQSGHGYVLMMKNPIQFLALSNNYMYTGQATIRGRLCYIYENVANFSFGGTYKEAVFQYYFAASSWHELAVSSNQDVKDQPVRFVVTAADASDTEIFDISDFNQEDPDLTNFNIQPCYQQSNQQAHFSIVFRLPEDPTISTNLVTFRQMTQLMLSQKAGISPLRLQNPQLITWGKVIAYLATLVQQAPAILDFTKVSDHHPEHSSDATYSVTSADECAGVCRNMTSFRCDSFDYCPTSGLCQLSKTHTSDGNIIHTSDTCQHYSKTVDGETTIEPTIQQALTIFQDQIDLGTMTLKLQPTATKVAVYQASRLLRDVIRYDKMAVKNANLDHFTRQYSMEPPKYSPTLGSVVSIDVCAQTCLTEVTFECQSFIYCPDFGYCRPSPDYLVKNSSISFDDLLACFVYSRRYTDGYERYPGRISVSPGDVTLSNVQDEEMCAKLCSSYSTFACKSFDYCSSTNSCFLRKSHRLPSSSPSIPTASCSHYARKYLYDFQITPKKSLLTEQVLTFFNETVENCAKLCVENSGYSCQSFTYCGNTSTCSITSSMTSASRSQITYSNSCDLYTRVYNERTPPLTQVQSQSQTNAKGYSSGVMAAVALVTLLVGIVLGAAVLYFCRTKALVERLQELQMESVDRLPDTDQDS